MEREEKKFYGRKIESVLKMNGCETAAKYSMLSIHPDQLPAERSTYKDNIYALHGRLFGQMCAPDEIENYVRENFLRKWFLMESQYQIQLEEERSYHKRMASFFIGKPMLDNNIRYQVVLDKEVGYIRSKLLQGKAHVLTRDEDGHKNAIVFKSGKPIYKKTARRADRKIENSPELLSMYIGLKPKYGADLRVSIVYLKSDNDAPDQPFTSPQIVTADFSKTEMSELKERLYTVLTSSSEKDCESCTYAAICNGELRLKKGDAPTGKKSEPKFTAAQQEVVNFGKGACAVYAVPGAGKTTTLVYRLCRMIDNGIDPKSIMFVTFTKKAAAEIKDRVKAILGTENEADLPDIFTYNGLGWQIIRDHPELVGQKKLLSPLDEKVLLLDVLDKTKEKLIGYSYSYIEGNRGMLTSLQKSFRSLLRDEDREMDSLAKSGHDSEQVRELLQKWLTAIKEKSYINYDDQVNLAVKILQEYPDCLATYGSRWHYIMADEFQDSSQENVDLLYMLAQAGGGNIVVVGDADQSIFEWRNGSPKHLLNFGHHFHAKKIVMDDNFRSSEKILDASNKLIARNYDRFDISMQPHIKGNILPYRARNAGIDSVLSILKLLKERNYKPEDIAILARTNSALNRCRKILDQTGIESVSPSDLLTKDLFFVIIKDLLTLYIDGISSNDMAFFRLCTAFGVELSEKDDPGKTFYEDLIDRKLMVPIDIHDMDSMLEYSVETEEERGVLYHAAKKIQMIFLEMQNDNPKYYVERAAEIIGYDPEDPAVKAMISVIEQHEPMDSLQQLKEYVGTMERIGDETMVEHGLVSGKINLMTAHGAKGKEFPAVIVLQSEDFKTSEEERRLMYVAMTRAKKVLFLMESPYSTCELLNELNGYVKPINLY